MSVSKTCVCGEESRAVDEVSPGQKCEMENLLKKLDDTAWARLMILRWSSTVWTMIVVVDIHVFSKAGRPCRKVVGIKRARCHPRSTPVSISPVVFFL
jgi:hypothetical protein